MGLNSPGDRLDCLTSHTFKVLIHFHSFLHSFVITNFIIIQYYLFKQSQWHSFKFLLEKSICFGIYQLREVFWWGWDLRPCIPNLKPNIRVGFQVGTSFLQFPNFKNQTIPKLTKTKSLENSVFRRALLGIEPITSRRLLVACLQH